MVPLGPLDAVIDSHCHLADARFAGEREAVLARAKAAGVEHIVVVTARASEWEVLHPSAATPERPALSLAYGIHPWYCAPDVCERFPLDRLERAVAIGECGLDFGPRGGERALQISMLRWQLDRAEEYRLPVVLHAYKSLDALTGEMARHPGLRFVLHGFRASERQLARLRGLDCYFGIDAAICDPRNLRLRALARQLPRDRILLESDAPDRLPRRWRGVYARNEPALLEDTARALAAALGMEPVELRRCTADNARRCFALSEPAEFRALRSSNGEG